MEYCSYLIAALICIVPLICGIIINKLYNVIQGIITFLFVSFLMYYIIDLVIGNNTFLSIEQLNLISSVMRVPYNLIYYMFTSLPKLYTKIIMIEPYFILTVVVFIYCSTQIISTTIKRLKNL